jgi:hypothetical protein
MNKFIILVAAIFTLWIVSPIGKIIQDVITTNNTYAYFTGNLSSIGWFVAYMRAWWWVMPLAVMVILMIQFMKKDEPEPYYPPTMPTMKMPRQRVIRQPKPVRQAKPTKPNPPIFFGK